MGVLIPNYDTRIKPPLGARLDTRHPLARGLAGCWLLNEGAGTVARDASGNGRAGTLTGSLSWRPGVSGPSVLSPGTVGANHILVSQSDAFNSLPAITVAARVCASGSQGTLSGIVSKYWDGTDRGWCIQVVSNKVRFLCSTDSQNDNDSADENVATGGAAGVWHHYVGTWNGANIRLYVDGVLQSDVPAQAGTVTRPNTAPVWIGHDYNGGSNSYVYNGLISEVMIYSRALSPDEIRSLYLDPYQMFRRSRLDLGLGALEGGPEPAGLSIAVAAHHLNQMRRAS